MSMFDLGELLKGAVPNSDTTEEQIEYIDIGLIDGDENNFYELSDVAALAANIETVGLQQPLRVRTSETDPLRVKIISGHRRKAALDCLVGTGNDKFRRVPVIREQVSGSAALQELKLIFANSDTRKISSADLSKQAERVEALLVQLREEGFDFPGRMRDHVAEACKVSKTKLANLKVIREKLIPEAKKAWEKGHLSEDPALTLARLPEERQKKICEAYSDYRKKSYGRAGLDYLSTGEVKNYAERLIKLENLKCPQGGGCTNKDRKWQTDVSRPYYYGSCHKQCCAKCDQLVSCKYACPKLAEQVKQLKADRKAAQAREKALKEEKDRPDRELQDLLWSRFAQARKDAGVTLAKLFEKWDVKYPSTYINSFEKFERGDGLRLGINTETPLHPYSSYLSHAKYLITLADTLDVSLDYLLGRTPCQKPEQMVFGVDLAESKPQWRTDAPPEGAVVLGKFQADGGKILHKTVCYRDGKYYFDRNSSLDVALPCAGWILLPED